MFLSFLRRDHTGVFRFQVSDHGPEEVSIAISSFLIIKDSDSDSSETVPDSHSRKCTQAQAAVDERIFDTDSIPRSALSTLSTNSRRDNINKGPQSSDKPRLSPTPGSLLLHLQQPTLISRPTSLTEEEAHIFSDAGVPLLTIGENRHQFFFCYRCKSAIPGNFLEVHFKKPPPSKRNSTKVYRHTSPSPGIIALAKADLKKMFLTLVMVGEGNKVSAKIKATLFPRRNPSTPEAEYPELCDGLETKQHGYKCTAVIGEGECRECFALYEMFGKHRKAHKKSGVKGPLTYNKDVVLQKLSASSAIGLWFRVVPKRMQADFDTEQLLIQALKELGLDRTHERSDLALQDHSVKNVAPIFVCLHWTDFIQDAGGSKWIKKLQGFMNSGYLSLEEHVKTYVYSSLELSFNPENQAFVYKIRKEDRCALSFSLKYLSCLLMDIMTLYQPESKPTFRLDGLQRFAQSLL
jgi:hypothetical protein